MLEINENKVCAEEKTILLSIKEASGLAGVSKDTIRRAIKQGILHGDMQDGKYGREYKIYKDSFMKWLEDRVMHANGAIQGVTTAEAGATLAQQGSAYGFKEGPAHGYTTVSLDILKKYEQAVYRSGWLEGQLDTTRKLLTESQESIRQREEMLIKEKNEAEAETRQKKEALVLAEEEKKKLSEKAENLEKQNKELQKELDRITMRKNVSWWKKATQTKEKIEADIEKELSKKYS